MTKISETLNKAADILAQEGKWTKGKWGDVSECMCAEGAIYAAHGLNPIYDTVSIAGDACEFLEKFLPYTDGNIIAEWNDDPDRTQDEVVAIIRKAAELAAKVGK